MSFVLKSILSDTRIATPACFPCLFAGIFFSQPFTFSLCRSFVLRWVSCRQHMCRSSFLIHSATLCLLIGAFNPFTFKSIIYKYLFIAIFPLLLCFSLSQSFSYLLKAMFITCLAMLVWRRCILFAFFCLENSLFHLLF